jgi:hypothetical protein
MADEHPPSLAGVAHHIADVEAEVDDTAGGVVTLAYARGQQEANVAGKLKAGEGIARERRRCHGPASALIFSYSTYFYKSAL